MSRERKSHFNFSSRTLFFGVTILAVLFATFGQRSVRRLNERRATSEILRLGGKFDYGHATSLKSDGLSSRLMALVLYEDFARVTGVSVDRTRINDDDLAVFKR